jgi:lipopolysaccharide export LptBFGC system permease protein LptF
LLRSIHNAGASPEWLVLTLVPQAVVLTLPAGLLVAIPVAISRTEPTMTLIRRVVLLSALYAGVTFGLSGWIVPAANQAFRVAASGVSEPPRGPNETPFTHVKKEIERLRTFHGSETVIRRMEYAYELRLSLAAAAVPLGLVALALAFTPVGRRRPFLTGLAAFGLYFLIIFRVEGSVVEFALRATSLPAGPLAWLPNACIVLLAGVLTPIAVRQPTARQSPT